MPIRARAHTRTPQSARYADFCDDVLKHAPGLVCVEFRHRAGTHGRYQHTPFDYPVSDEERGDAQLVIDGVTNELEKFDQDEGPGLSWEARVKLAANGEAKELGPYRFRLVEDEDEDEDAKGQLRSAVKTTQHLEKMLMRSWDRTESILEKASGLLGPSVELEKVKIEHQERMRGFDVEEAEDQQMWGFFKMIGPKWLLTQAAKQEREKGFKDGEKREIWKRIKTVAALVVEREEVRECLGEKCTDIVEQLGQARTEAEAEQLIIALKSIQAATGRPDIFALVKVAPELLPFADMLTED